MARGGYLVEKYLLLAFLNNKITNRGIINGKIII